MESIAVPIAALIISAAGLFIASRNASRVDQALTLSASTQAFNELSRRVDILEDENKRLKDAIARCEDEKLNLLLRLAGGLHNDP